MKEHWTTDEDLLAEYVLGRIAGKRRAELDLHLQACDQCRRVVMGEERLAATIKSAGRMELSERLRSRIQKTPSNNIPWPRVLSIAAVVVTLLGVGVYYDWFAAHEPASSASNSMDTVVNEPRVERAESPSSRINKPEAATSEFRNKAKEVPSVEREAAPLTSAKKNKQEAAAANDKLEFSNPSDVTMDAGADVAAKVDATSMQKDVDDAMIWIIGNIQERDFTGRADADEADGPRRAEESRKRLSAQGAPQAEGISNRTAISIEQRPFAMLPQKQQLQQRDQVQTVQAHLQRTASGLQLLLYPHEPIPESVLERAHVELIADDSIVVEFGDQLIGYRIPPGILPYQIPSIKK